MKKTDQNTIGTNGFVKCADKYVQWCRNRCNPLCNPLYHNIWLYCTSVFPVLIPPEDNTAWWIWIPRLNKIHLQCTLSRLCKSQTFFPLMSIWMWERTRLYFLFRKMYRSWFDLFNPLLIRHTDNMVLSSLVRCFSCSFYGHYQKVHLWFGESYYLILWLVSIILSMCVYILETK